MREKPILFSGPMVRAILEGRKVQTRRVMRTPRECTLYGRQPIWDRAWVDGPGGFDSQQYLHLPYAGGDLGEDAHGARIYSPWRSGDRLWVRETWSTGYSFDKTRPGEIPEIVPCSIPIWYAATIDSDNEHSVNRGRWRPSIHMPRWASRLTLEITDVRAQRVQEITEDDAMAEGFYQAVRESPNGVGQDVRGWFRSTWDFINDARGYGWDVNPWVWAITFRRVG